VGDVSELPRIVDGHETDEDMRAARGAKTNAYKAEGSAKGDGKWVEGGIHRYEGGEGFGKSAEVYDGEKGEGEKGEQHKDALEGVGQANGEEPAYHGVAEDEERSEENAGGEGATESGREGFAAGYKLRRDVSGHEHKDDEDEQAAKDAGAIVEAGGEEVGDGDAISGFGKAAKAWGVEKDEGIFDGDVADHGPDRGEAAGVRHAGHAQKEPCASPRNHGGDCYYKPVHAPATDKILAHPLGGEAGGCKCDPDENDEVAPERKAREGEQVHAFLVIGFLSQGSCHRVFVSFFIRV